MTDDHQHGTCVVTKLGDDFVKPHPALRVDVADDHVLITAELLVQVARGGEHPDVTFDGEVLRIKGCNRTVAYRIGAHRFVTDDYCADRIEG